MRIARSTISAKKDRAQANRARWSRITIQSIAAIHGGTAANAAIICRQGVTVQQQPYRRQRLQQRPQRQLQRAQLQLRLARQFRPFRQPARLQDSQLAVPERQELPGQPAVRQRALQERLAVRQRAPQERPAVRQRAPQERRELQEQPAVQRQELPGLGRLARLRPPSVPEPSLRVSGPGSAAGLRTAFLQQPAVPGPSLEQQRRPESASAPEGWQPEPLEPGARPGLLSSSTSGLRREWRNRRPERAVPGSTWAPGRACSRTACGTVLLPRCWRTAGTTG
jgi:hypothetical protein